MAVLLCHSLLQKKREGQKEEHDVQKQKTVSKAGVPIGKPERPVEKTKDESISLSVEKQMFQEFLRLVVRQGKIKLSSEEFTRLTSIYLEAFEATSRLEVQTMRLDSTTGTITTLKVAPFPAEGAVIKELFSQRIANEFPSDKAAEIAMELGPQFSQRLKAYGNSEQTIVIERMVGYEPYGRFRVTWTVDATQAAKSPNDAGSPWSSYSSTYEGTVDSVNNNLGGSLGRFIKATWPSAQ
jgi:hypothetical protein